MSRPSFPLSARQCPRSCRCRFPARRRWRRRSSRAGGRCSVDGGHLGPQMVQGGLASLVCRGAPRAMATIEHRSGCLHFPAMLLASVRHDGRAAPRTVAFVEGIGAPCRHPGRPGWADRIAARDAVVARRGDEPRARCRRCRSRPVHRDRCLAPSRRRARSGRRDSRPGLAHGQPSRRRAVALAGVEAVLNSTTAHSLRSGSPSSMDVAIDVAFVRDAAPAPAVDLDLVQPPAATEVAGRAAEHRRYAPRPGPCRRSATATSGPGRARARGQVVGAECHAGMRRRAVCPDPACLCCAVSIDPVSRSSSACQNIVRSWSCSASPPTRSAIRAKHGVAGVAVAAGLSWRVHQGRGGDQPGSDPGAMCRPISSGQ